MGIGLAFLIASLLTAAGTAYSNAKTNKANKQLAQYQYDQERQAIAEQNKYNDPASQMARLQRAGLNPAMIYNTGASSAVGNQTQIAKYSAPTQKFDNWLESATNLPAYLMQSSNLKQQSVQRDNILASTNYTNQKTLSEAVNTAKMGTEAKSAELKYQNDLKLSPYNLSKQALEVKSSELRNSNLQNMLNMNDLQVRKLNQELQQGSLNLKTTQNLQDIQKADLLFKKYENELRSKGVTSSDNVILRSAIQNAGAVKDWMSKAWDTLKYGFGLDK